MMVRKATKLQNNVDDAYDEDGCGEWWWTALGISSTYVSVLVIQVRSLSSFSGTCLLEIAYGLASQT